ncbi:VanW family protein [Desulforamulus reducens MI-1]|uniref:VanW family protein n=2 Tax=Desulforamulus TaxID=2916693 RepID=A4J2R7_DESRM|nr:VanW family protein [Desulforamulus reducens MI-1]
MTHSFCQVCLIMLLAEFLATALYYWGKLHINQYTWVSVPSIATLVMAILLFALNPIVLAKEKTPTVAAAPKKENSIKQMETIPMPKQDERMVEQGGRKPVVKGIGPKLNVYTPQGSETELDLSEKPALLFAWWCPHCDYVLQEIAQYSLSDRPYLVVTNLKGDDLKAIDEKLKANGLAGVPYFLYYEQPPVESVPASIWWSEGKLNTSPGYSIKPDSKKLLSKARIPITKDNGGKNAILAGKAIDGAVIPPGGIFSFNQIVGERSPERGYRVSGVIESDGNGGYKYSQGTGGGVCRTSTVVHWAAKKASLEVAEYHKHSLPVAYGKVDEDAAVAWPYADYKFRNNTGDKLSVKVQHTDSWLEVEIWKG